MLNLPNFLTLIRIAAIPFFLVLLSSGWYTGALVVFVLGGVTDALDGALARWTHQQTALGAYLDPLADKLLLVSSFLLLVFIDAVPIWLAILVVSRDLIITVGYGAICLLVEERMEVRPSPAGKLNTFMELVSVTAVLVSLHDPQLVLPSVSYYLFILTGVTTIISGFQYVYRGLVWLQNRAPSLNG